MFALSACGKKETAAPAAANGAPAGAVSGSSASSELKLAAKNFKFDQAEYKVKIKVTLENKEGTYDIICIVPCGAGHATMKSELIVEA